MPIDSTVYIECLSEMSTVQWYKEDGTMKENVNYRPPLNFHEYHTLVITNVQEDNYGTYVCEYQDHTHSRFMYFRSKSMLDREGR